MIRAGIETGQSMGVRILELARPKTPREQLSIALRKPKIDDKKVNKILEISSREDGLMPLLFASPSFGRSGTNWRPYQSIPAQVARQALDIFDPQETDVIDDFGCGFGKFLFIGGVMYPGKYRGFDVVHNRVEQAQRITEKLQLPQAKVEVAVFDIKKIPFTQYGTKVLLNNPFDGKLPQTMQEQIFLAGSCHPLEVITYHMEPAIIPGFQMYQDEKMVYYKNTA